MSTGTLHSPQRPIASGNVDVQKRTEIHYEALFSNIYRKTDRMFALLIGLQWLASAVTAIADSSPGFPPGLETFDLHLTFFVAGPIALAAIVLALRASGKTFTRHYIAVAQMVASGVLIQLTAGRSETNFHVFGSLAFLAFYRDWRVLVTASLAIAVNHFVRGLYYPLVLFGTVDFAAWRWLEYIGWVLFEDFFLFYSCMRTVRLLKEVAHNRAELEFANVITELAVIERTKELAETNLRLQANIEERQRTEILLTKAKETADMANRTKSEFLANMSHEIRTPMNGVLGMSTLLLETSLSEQQRDFTETIRQSSDALLIVINDILDFSKIEASTIELAEVDFELRTCIEETLDLFALKAAEKKLELLYVLDESVPTQVAGDPMRLRQILVNVIGNAIKFTERGSVFIEIHSQPLGRAERRGSASAERWHEFSFQIRDTGIGISADRKDRLFKPFAQADTSMSRRYGGTGLGLAISKRIAEAMSGGISFVSTVGKGSCFTVNVKLRAPEDFTEAPFCPSLAGKCLLIADDRELSQKIFAIDARTWGLDPHCVSSLAYVQARLAEKDPIDALLFSLANSSVEEIKGVCDRAHSRKIPVLVVEPVGRASVGTKGSLHPAIAGVLYSPVKTSLLKALLLQAIDAGQHSPRMIDRRPGFTKLSLELPLRILLTEDNLVNQRVATRFLAAMGYNCDLAGNGLEAVEAAAREKYDLIFMDLQMPEMDGYEATKEIRTRLHLSPRPQIVALTAHASSTDRDQCLRAGMDDYLTKPLSVSMLEQKLRDAALRLGMTAQIPAPAEAYSI